MCCYTWRFSAKRHGTVIHNNYLVRHFCFFFWQKVDYKSTCVWYKNTWTTLNDSIKRVAFVHVSDDRIRYVGVPRTTHKRVIIQKFWQEWGTLRPFSFLITLLLFFLFSFFLCFRSVARCMRVKSNLTKIVKFFTTSNRRIKRIWQ